MADFLRRVLRLLHGHQISRRADFRVARFMDFGHDGTRQKLANQAAAWRHVVGPCHRRRLVCAQRGVDGQPGLSLRLRNLRRQKLVGGDGAAIYRRSKEIRFRTRLGRFVSRTVARGDGSGEYRLLHQRVAQWRNAAGDERNAVVAYEQFAADFAARQACSRRPDWYFRRSLARLCWLLGCR